MDAPPILPLEHRGPEALRSAARTGLVQLSRVLVGKDQLVRRALAALLSGCLLYTSDAADE